METLRDVVPALITAIGLALLGSLLLGWFLRPVSENGFWILVPGEGNGEHLERDLRGLMWLRNMGLLSCPVAIADVSLSQEGREVAFRLIVRWPDVVLWPVDALDELARMPYT